MLRIKHNLRLLTCEVANSHRMYVFPKVVILIVEN